MPWLPLIQMDVTQSKTEDTSPPWSACAGPGRVGARSHRLSSPIPALLLSWLCDFEAINSPPCASVSSSVKSGQE